MSSSPAKTLILVGATGRMGQQTLKLLEQDTWKQKFPKVYSVTSKTQVSEVENLTDAVVIDFSVPQATLNWCKVWSRLKTPTLICTTGFNRAEYEDVKKLMGETPWAFTPNTSLGIFAFLHSLVNLIKFFPDIKSIEVHDVHHIHKKDSPSGTAKLIKAAIAVAGYKGEVPIKSSREGEVVGIHSVIVQREYDRFIFTHDAQDRMLFAEGALTLAEKLAAKAPRSEPYTFEELVNP